MPEADVSSLFLRTESSLGMVLCADIDSKGSGFMVSPNGHFVTCHHVVAEPALQGGYFTYKYSDEIKVKVQGRWHEAEILGDKSDLRPRVFDYALLRLKGVTATPYLAPADLASINQGKWIVCLGFPLDFETPVATAGILSAVVDRKSHINTLYRMRTFLTDAVVQFGVSGGPMLDVESEKVVGIVTLHHELRVQLAMQLMQWLQAQQGQQDQQQVLVDLASFVLKYVSSGLNHAVSLEYALADPCWPKES